MRRIIAIKEVRYAGENRYPGDEFEASDLDAKILTATDISGGPKARYADEPAKPAAVKTRALEPEHNMEVEAPEATSWVGDERVRRTYKRRDLKPEGN